MAERAAAANTGEQLRRRAGQIMVTSVTSRCLLSAPEQLTRSALEELTRGAAPGLAPASPES